MTQWLSGLETVLQTYGYWAVFLGAMVEGESLILTASALAAKNMLSIWVIAAVTFAGTLMADQLIFLLGHWYGPASVRYVRQRWPSVNPLIDKVLSFLGRNETVFMLSFRFIYGIRIISPFVLGAYGISFRRFSLLNIAAAALWTVLSCAAGYFLGSVFERIEWVVLAIVVLVVVISRVVAKRSSGSSGPSGS